jgi:NMD protein affecting ribosome stability and mRNA decay
MNEFRVLCTDCGRDFKCEKAGVLIKELFMGDKEVYRVWNADLLRCPGCNIMIISRFADNPAAEHWNKETMTAVLQKCNTRTLGKDLFIWREHSRNKLAYKAETTTRGKPEDA